MTKSIDVIIENKLIAEKRDMNVYHHASRSAHMISHNSSITLPLRSVVEDDYLHISIVSGPGKLEKNCVVSLPSWLDFQLSSAGDATISRADGRTYLKIPPGPPVWQLKMTRALSYDAQHHHPRITVGDENAGDSFNKAT